MNNLKTIATSVLLLLFIVAGQAQSASKTTIAELPSLPPEKEGNLSLGYAGMLGGGHNDVLIAGGGANFPKGLPWKGGEKVYSDKIYILKKGKWELSAQRLPRPLAHSDSVAIPEGILISRR